MTTDITELAQSLKAAAEKAIGANERLSVYKNDEIIDISQHEGEQIDIDIADINLFLGEANPANILTLVEALEKAQQVDEELCNLLPPGVEYMDPPDGGDVTPLEGVRRMVADYRQRIAELESRTVKLPDGWQFEECEIEGCENGAIFSVGTGSRNIHLCDKCAHEPQNSRLKKSPLSKRLPFKMSAGIKVEAE
ncbi:TPA: ead/Ea22-like family protein [Klebsiella pneumoniae]